MPIQATVKLRKLCTDDGLTGLRDGPCIGDEYVIFPATLRPMIWGRDDKPEMQVTRLSVYVAASGRGGPGWMPCELLEMESYINEIARSLKQHFAA